MAKEISFCLSFHYYLLSTYYIYATSQAFPVNPLSAHIIDSIISWTDRRNGLYGSLNFHLPEVCLTIAATPHISLLVVVMLHGVEVYTKRLMYGLAVLIEVDTRACQCGIARY